MSLFPVILWETVTRKNVFPDNFQEFTYIAFSIILLREQGKPQGTSEPRSTFLIVQYKFFRALW